MKQPVKDTGFKHVYTPSEKPKQTDVVAVNRIKHVHAHSHHREEDRQAVLHRLSRAIGHLEHVKLMVENDQPCDEVLIQLAAVRAALNNAGKFILTNHIETCIVDAVRNNEMDEIDNLRLAIERFIK